MKWQRKDESNDLVLVTDGGGVFVTGSAAEVAQVVDELLGVVGGAGQAVSVVANETAVLASGLAGVKSRTQYVQFSERSQQLLSDHAPIPTKDGTFHSFVRSRAGIAGNLDWSPVSLGPERALALQQAAVGLALRAAIQDVQAAVERVEGKVKVLEDLLEAKWVGEAVGTHRVLRRHCDALDRNEAFTDTDWATLAGLGPEIVMAIESVRMFLRRHVSNADGGWTDKDHLKEARRLLDDAPVREMFAILLVCEENLALWQRLRLAQMAKNEPEHLPAKLADARAQLLELREADQRLVDLLDESVHRLTGASGYEGLKLWRKDRMRQNRKSLHDEIAWFAQRRTLDISPPEELDLASLRQSAVKIARTASQAGRAAAQAVRDSTDSTTGRTEAIASDRTEALRAADTSALPSADREAR